MDFICASQSFVIIGHLKLLKNKQEKYWLIALEYYFTEIAEPMIGLYFYKSKIINNERFIFIHIKLINLKNN